MDLLVGTLRVMKVHEMGEISTQVGDLLESLKFDMASFVHMFLY